MHGLIGSEMGWIAVPFIFVVGVAYVWIVDRLLSRSAGARTAEQTTTNAKDTKVAKAA
jgi:hypothetical protein